MILTESEAREKWCPFVRFHGTPSDDNMSNRDGGVDNGNPGMSRCLGSGCMAWRLVETSLPAPVDVPPEEVPFWEERGYRKKGMILARVRMELPPQDLAPRGFCGLAGKP